MIEQARWIRNILQVYFHRHWGLMGPEWVTLGSQILKYPLNWPHKSLFPTSPAPFHQS